MTSDYARTRHGTVWHKVGSVKRGLVKSSCGLVLAVPRDTPAWMLTEKSPQPGRPPVFATLEQAQSDTRFKMCSRLNCQGADV